MPQTLKKSILSSWFFYGEMHLCSNKSFDSSFGRYLRVEKMYKRTYYDEIFHFYLTFEKLFSCFLFNC